VFRAAAAARGDSVAKLRIHGVAIFYVVTFFLDYPVKWASSILCKTQFHALRKERVRKDNRRAGATRSSWGEVREFISRGESITLL
jgi:hypothetical protein